jgi:hypothetical protein
MYFIHDFLLIKGDTSGLKRVKFSVLMVFGGVCEMHLQSHVDAFMICQGQTIMVFVNTQN